MKLNPKDHDWMTSKAIQRLFKAFPKGELRFVGGCVRNALLSEAVRDIDLSTRLEPKEVIAALTAAQIKSVPTGINHGTVTAVIKGKPFEITSLRKDVETDGRRAVVTFTKDWVEDAQRRDFTINALYADADGHIYDPTGEALADIETRTLHFISDANERVREDYLRILRYFRFLAWYGGEAKIDAAALKACRENRTGLAKVSAERIWNEIKRLLEAPRPERACRIMLTNEILEEVLPEASNVEGLELIVKMEQQLGMDADPLLRLMGMASRDELAMARLCQRLKLSKAEKTRLMGWAGDRTSFDQNGDDRACKTTVYYAGNQVAMDRAIVRAAGADDPNKQARWLALYEFAKDWVPPKFPLRGKDLQQQGVAEGPEIGKKLDALRALWIRSGFTADKPRLLQALALINR